MLRVLIRRAVGSRNVDAVRRGIVSLRTSRGTKDGWRRRRQRAGRRGREGRQKQRGKAEPRR